MQKSFHIALIKPFFGNMQKELTKMPKIYFCDLGLRNFFANNFDNFVQRSDKGEVLENAVFRQLKQKYENDALRFWRTQNKNEVDFIVDGKQAFEVKVNESKFNLKKYKNFKDLYPDIALSVISIDKKNKQTKDEISVFNVWELEIR